MSRNTLVIWFTSAIIALVVAWFVWPRSKPAHFVTASSRNPTTFLKVAASDPRTPMKHSSKTGGTIPHLYSPLTAPPPVDSPEAIRQYNQLLWGWLTPNINGPPLVTTYKSLVEKANQGDADAALALYRDLRFCRTSVPQSAELKQEYIVNNMAAHLDKDVAFYQAAYKYCGGLTSAQQYQEDNWLWLAAKGGNLDAQAMVQADTLISQNKQQQAQKAAWLENAAQHGNLDALSNMTTVAYFAQHSRVKMYAYYATIYLLTQSPTAAWHMHYESQFLSPFRFIRQKS